MATPVPVVLEADDAAWLRSMVDNSAWPGAASEIITRIRMALAHALETEDEDELGHGFTPQEKIGAAEFGEL
ncbi:MAG: hypothetical protein GY937_22845 [bacterium]|nr:hypothetical protein [bacterium]